ncbi:hypothetical protein [Neptuniibacter halophilus]|uniref:hypothetical protein n=1 Tax=Neptuniibacter halophilus TaxID=651666 RepID=UPI00257467CE|nr:hypothetical protein [Neptuniibacter halophilus]
MLSIKPNFQALLLVPAVLTFQPVMADEEIEALMDSVPAGKVDRTLEIEKLDHLDAKYKKIASITASLNAIKETEGNQPSVQQEILSPFGAMEKLLTSSLDQAIDAGSVVQRSGEDRSSSGFSTPVALLSIWGNPKDPTADVVINKRQQSIKKGSNLNGWVVLSVSAEYLELQKGKTVSKVFYSEAGEES